MRRIDAMFMEHPPPLLKDVTYPHTVRLSRELHERMLFRAKERYESNVQRYLVAIIKRDTDLPDIPDCGTCGFKAMGEFIILKLREGR